MNDQELDKILTSLREEEAPHLGSVSRRVMRQIESDQRRRTWMALDGAAAAIVALILSIPRTPPEQHLAIQQPMAPAAPAIAWVKPPPVRQVALAKPVNLRQAKGGPLELRMQTDDPDVLIIWLVDGEEDQKGNR